jgi:hypothetical protein
MRKGEGWTDSLQCPEISVDHRRLARSEAEDSMVRLTPLFLQDACAGSGIGTRRALDFYFSVRLIVMNGRSVRIDTLLQFVLARA